jgi:hypothetical protein
MKFVNPEARKGYPTALHHYLDKGIDEGLNPCWAYDEGFYLNRYVDILDAVRAGELSCGFEHFSRYGHSEGRVGSAHFDESAYLRAHPDVAAAVKLGEELSGSRHYIKAGWREKRAIGS